MKLLLAWIAAIWLTLALLIGVALVVEHAAAEPHFQQLQNAFSAGQCAQPCWRDIAFDKLPVGSIKTTLNADPALKVVNSNSTCELTWLMAAAGSSWRGRFCVEGPPDGTWVELKPTTDQKAFTLLDAIALYGQPQAMECALGGGIYSAFTFTVFLDFKGVVKVQADLPFDRSGFQIDPMWPVDYVMYEQPIYGAGMTPHPWRGFRWVPYSELQDLCGTVF